MQNTAERLLAWWRKSTRNQKIYAGLLAFSLLATGAFLLMTGGESASPSGTTAASPDAGLSDPFFYAGIFIKLVAVLGIFIGGALLLRRWKLHSLGSANGRRLNVVESVRLSPKQALHLVRVGDRELLIGATDQGIALISSVDAQSTPPAAPQPVEALEFSSVLQSFALRADQPAPRN